MTERENQLLTLQADMKEKSDRYCETFQALRANRDSKNALGDHIKSRSAYNAAATAWNRFGGLPLAGGV